MTDTIIVRWDRGQRLAVLPVCSAAPSSCSPSMSGIEWWSDGDGWERRRKARLKHGNDRAEFYDARPLRTPVQTGRRRVA